MTTDASQGRDDRIARFREMVLEDPENELAQFSLGQALLDAGRPAEAEVHFALTAALQPDHMMAWYRRAECLMQLERFAEARPLAEKTIELAVAQNHVAPKADAEEMLEEIEDALG